MEHKSTQAEVTARTAIGVQLAALLVYAIYGIGFGLLAVVVGSFAGFSVAMVGSAYIAFGALATLQRSKALPATRAKHAALAVTHTIALLWGLAVTIPVACLILGAIYLPLPIAGLGSLWIPSVLGLYWTGRLPCTG